MRTDNLEAETLTDGFDVCKSSGAGLSTNQTYKKDGTRHEGHKTYDRSFYCQKDEQTCLYAVFTGQHGHKVAELAIQRISAEILFDQLNGCNPEGVKEVLRQAFSSVERDYLNWIDQMLLEKAKLQGDANRPITEFPHHILKQIIEINHLLTIGSSAVLALIYYNKLYICNIGNCRALLCKTDENNVLRVIQLSVDHNISNDEERQRICKLGLDAQALVDGPFETTRCIGCYNGKRGYKDASLLSSASSEPVISQPEIVGPIAIDPSCRFLVLMSGGLCKTLREIYSNETNVVNREIVQIIVEQFRTQSTMSGVSQSAVHQIVQRHHDSYMREEGEATFENRKDITLLVRNFNFPMPNSINSQRNRNNVTFNPDIQEHTNGLSNSDNSNIIDTSSSYPPSTNSSISDSNRPIFDPNHRINPYVSFADYYRNVADYVEKAKTNGTLADFIDFD